MSNVKRFTAAAVMATACLSAYAQDAAPDKAKIQAMIEQVMPGAKVSAINAQATPALYEVIVGADVLYVSADGKFVVQGDVLDMDKQVNVTEEARGKERRKVMATIDPETMISFVPKDAKYVVTVFTDIDCGYCRKLHSEIAEYNKRGIGVRYLAFPRSGMNTPSYYKAVNAWCAKDRQKALTDAKLEKPVPEAPKDCNSPVERHLNLAHQLNLGGTPTIVLDDGSMIPGYVPPARLLSTLQKDKKPAGG